MPFNTGENSEGNSDLDLDKMGNKLTSPGNAIMLH